MFEANLVYSKFQASQGQWDFISKQTYRSQPNHNIFLKLCVCAPLVYIWVSTEDRRRHQITQSWITHSCENQRWVLWKNIKSSQPLRHISPGLKPPILTWYPKLRTSNLMLCFYAKAREACGLALASPPSGLYLHTDPADFLPQCSSCCLSTAVHRQQIPVHLVFMLWNPPCPLKRLSSPQH